VGQFVVGIDGGEERSDIGQREGIRVVRCQKPAAFFHQIGVVRLFIDDEIELLLELEDILLEGTLLEGKLGFFQQAAHLGILHEAHELAVARLAELQFEKRQAGSLGVACFQHALRLGGEGIAEFRLALHELPDERLVASN
jgi:hypothetical protein